MQKKWFLNPNLGIAFGLILGVLSGIGDIPALTNTANAVSEIFINLLKLLSTPIIFFSILSTVSGMKNVSEFKNVSGKLIKYTLLTTYISAFIALILFFAFDLSHSLVRTSDVVMSTTSAIGNVDTHNASNASFDTHNAVVDTHNAAIDTHNPSNKGYIDYLIKTVPSNLLSPFIESHVIAVLFLAILFSLGTLALPEPQRNTINQVVSSINALFMKLASWVIYWIPIAIWSFITVFFKEMKDTFIFKPLALYLGTIVAANLIQGFVVLPILSKIRGVSPSRLAMHMMPAISLAFFSKSSSATIPTSIRCAQTRAGMSKKLSEVAFPLCTAINMNGCAAFILVTVLFVSMCNGVQFSPAEMVLWTVIATIAAIGNAGVPMGCYFLSTAFLAAMDVPLTLMAIILPFHALIDMLETAINVWSDSCVVAIVDKESSEITIGAAQATDIFSQNITRKD